MKATVHKTEQGWIARWTDFHSFAHGVEWNDTLLHPDDQSSPDLEEGKKVEVDITYDENFKIITRIKKETPIVKQLATDEFIRQIKENSEKPFVTAQFGDHWKEHIREQFDNGDIDVESIINIAWKQGRQSLLLERELRKLL